MTAWARVPGGWALNLDGSDAAAVFSLPRLEARAGPNGWQSLCLSEDGSRRENAKRATASVWEAKDDALALGCRALGPAHAAALAELRRSGTAATR